MEVEGEQRGKGWLGVPADEARRRQGRGLCALGASDALLGQDSIKTNFAFPASLTLLENLS